MARAAVRAHLIFLKLVLIKTIIFNVAGLKALAASSALLMGILNYIPHIDVVDAATLSPVDMSISNTVYPVVTDTEEINVYMIYTQSETPNWSPENVTVTATIPAGTIFDSASVTPSSISPTTVTWNLPSNDNTHVMILLRLLVDPAAQGTLSSVATVSANNTDPYTSNNTATASIVVGNDGSMLGDVDLFVNKQVDLAQASVTDELEYTITYGNNGSDTATNTQIYDIVPSNMYVVSASPEPTGTTGANNSVLVWDLGNLPAGMGWDITLTVSLYPLLEEWVTVSNNVVIDSDIYESNFDNNVDEASTQIMEWESQLYADIYTSDDTVCSGDTVEFVINFGNQWAADANSVTITNDMPSALQYLYSSEPYSSVAGSEFTRNIAGQLFPGDQWSFTVTTKAVSAGVGVTNIVVANEEGVPVASGAFSIDILTPEVCEYLGGDKDDDTGTGKNNPPVTPPTNEQEEEEDDEPELDPVDGLDGYDVRFDTETPLLNNPIDLTIQLIPDNIVPASYTKSLSILMQKKSGTKWVEDDASNYTLTIPTVSATFTKTALRTKTWANAITIKSAWNYRVKIFETANDSALGYGYLTVAPSLARAGTGDTEGTGWTDDDTPTQYITGTNITTGWTTGITQTWRPIDAAAAPTATAPTNPSIPKTTRPAATTPKKTATVDPNNPFVRRNVGLTTAERRNQEELRDAIKRATASYTAAPVTCEDGYREVFAYAQVMKLTTARSLEDFRPCDPIQRIDAIKVFVLRLLDSWLVEPDLKGKANYEDIGGLSNEQQFYANLGRDFRLIGNGPKLRPLENITIQETALITTNVMFGNEFIKSPATQFTDAINLMDRAKLMRKTDKGGEAISKGELFQILYRADFGEVPESSRYIRMNAKK